MAVKRRIERLEQKRGGGFRIVLQKDVKQSLIDEPLAWGEILIALDDGVADL
jgi:hypothetical protein